MASIYCPQLLARGGLNYPATSWRLRDPGMTKCRGSELFLTDFLLTLYLEMIQNVKSLKGVCGYIRGSLLRYIMVEITRDMYVPTQIDILLTTKYY